MHYENQRLEDQLRQVRSQSKQELDNQQGELLKALELVKIEVEKKYHQEMKELCLAVREIKQRMCDELLTKEKEVR